MKIQDQYTDLPVTRQRKYQLRHPEREAERVKRYDDSEAGKASRRERNARYREKQKQLSTANSKKTLDNPRGFANI
jgi:hypothetical protein